MPQKNEYKQAFLIVVAGPTSVGKTAVAIELAQHFNTEIISADSRQIFQELNIGVARPSEEELQKVKHHFIADKSIHHYFSAGEYEREAIQLIDKILKEKDIVIVCGGTGFYINAILYGFDEMPKIDEQIRTSLNKQFQENGIQPLQEQLRQLDEATYQTIDIKNPQRVIRALEVCLGTGKKFSSFKDNKNVNRNFKVIKIGLHLPKEKLHHNINLRVDKMMEQGLLEEAKSVYDFRNHNALQTVGYKEIFEYIDGKISLENAIEQIKLHTRQYAKRQLTFFNKNKDYTWFEPNAISDIITFILEKRK